jgi:hypothetical protein
MTGALRVSSMSVVGGDTVLADRDLAATSVDGRLVVFTMTSDGAVATFLADVPGSRANGESEPILGIRGCSADWNGRHRIVATQPWSFEAVIFDEKHSPLWSVYIPLSWTGAHQAPDHSLGAVWPKATLRTPLCGSWGTLLRFGRVDPFVFRTSTYPNGGHLELWDSIGQRRLAVDVGNGHSYLFGAAVTWKDLIVFEDGDSRLRVFQLQQLSQRTSGASHRGNIAIRVLPN